MNFTKIIKSLTSATMFALVIALPSHAADVNGIKLDEKITLGGKELLLNGAGQRQIAFIKFYVIGLYVSRKKATIEEIQELDGPRRVILHLQRDIDSDEFSQLFITTMNKNSTKEEKAKLINQTVKFGEMFVNVGKIKKGDIVTLDWIPETGTVTSINGVKAGEALSGVAFNNALLRIWMGENPVNSELKRNLLGNKG